MKAIWTMGSWRGQAVRTFTGTLIQPRFTSSGIRRALWPRPTFARYLSEPAKTKVPQSLLPDSNPTALLPADLEMLSKTAPTDQGSVSCSIFDKDGNVTAVSKKFSKSQFLADNKLFPRDLRKIDSSNVDVAPSIAVRHNCILVNMLHIKALIKSDQVMVFDVANQEYAQRLSLFMYDLESKLKTKTVHVSNNPDSAPIYYSSMNQPFEFRALECILMNVMGILESEVEQQTKACSIILAQLDQQIDRAKLRDLLVRSKNLTTFNQKAVLIRDTLDDVLDNDDDLESMYLTGSKQHKVVDATPKAVDDKKVDGHKPMVVDGEHEEVDTGDLEMLLEAYYKQCDEIVQQAETTINDIKSTEEVVNIILDANRNSLMVYELQISIYTLGFTVATLIPAFYGMNLKNYFEDSNLAFGLVVAFSTFAGLAMVGYAFRKLRFVQKMTAVSSKRMTQVDERIRTRHLRKKYGQRDHKRDIVKKWLIGR